MLVKSKRNKWSISTKMDINYSVIEYPNLFSSDNPNLFGGINKLDKPRRLLIVDKNIEKLYGKKIRSYFEKHMIFSKIITIEMSEKYKTTETLFAVLKEFDDFDLLRRKEPVIAIGGGVLLDIVGFAANLYRRGVPYIRVPTTLIGLIDAGIGVKTGINFNGHKNRIGTYYQPLSAYIDLTFLATLDEKHISNGMAETLKMSLVKDKSLFNLLERHGKNLLMNKFQDLPIARKVIHKAIEGMLEELEPNLWELSLERIVDFGHTFSGALEMKSHPHLLHGQAVNIDMALASILAFNRKLISKHELSRIFSVMAALKLPIYDKLCEANILYSALNDTTSHRDGLQRFPILKSIGNAIFINDLSYREIENAVKILKEISSKT